MNCSKHPKNKAVAQCENCGAFICERCATVTKAFKEATGTLCRDCCGNVLQNMIGYYQEKKSGNIKKIIVSIIFYIIGICLAIYPVSILIEQGTVMLLNPVVSVMLVGAIILCGFYTGISFLKTAQKEREEYERKHGVQYLITENGIYREKGTGTKVLYFLGGTVFGVALTPIMLIVYGVGITVAKKHINETRETYNDLMTV